MRLIKPYHGYTTTKSKFAFLPVRLRRVGSFEEVTILWERYDVKVRYETDYSLLSFLFFGKDNLPIREKELFLVEDTL